MFVVFSSFGFLHIIFFPPIFFFAFRHCALAVNDEMHFVVTQRVVNMLSGGKIIHYICAFFFFFTCFFRYYKMMNRISWTIRLHQTSKRQAITIFRKNENVIRQRSESLIFAEWRSSWISSGKNMKRNMLKNVLINLFVKMCMSEYLCKR